MCLVLAMNLLTYNIVCAARLVFIAMDVILCSVSFQTLFSKTLKVESTKNQIIFENPKHVELTL